MYKRRFVANILCDKFFNITESHSTNITIVFAWIVPKWMECDPSYGKRIR